MLGKKIGGHFGPVHTLILPSTSQLFNPSPILDAGLAMTTPGKYTIIPLIIRSAK
jgi:hypothetical protein